MKTRLDGKIEDVYWAIVSQEKACCPKDINRNEYDLIIVGAGYAGLSSAFHAAKKGLSVLVLEAYSIGSGASGRNGGAVVPAYPGAVTIEDVKAATGISKGEKYSKLVNEAADYLFQIIRQYDIKCHPVQNGFIQPAHSEKSYSKVQRVYHSWKNFGADIQWLSGNEIKQQTGAHGYLGGWLQKTGGTVEPYALAQGIARIALEAGADISEDNSVDAIEKVDGKYCVTASRGCYTAKKILIATNAYTQHLAQPLAKSVIPVRLYHTMTRPLTAQERKAVLPNGTTFTDLRKSGGFGRLDSQGRLQSGGAVFTLAGKNYGKDHARLRMKELFPVLEGIELEYYWEGYCAITEEWLPSIKIHDKGFYSFVGFSTRGVATSFSVGRDIADILSEEISVEDSALFIRGKDGIHLQSLKEYLGGLAFPIYKARDKFKLS